MGVGQSLPPTPMLPHVLSVAQKGSWSSQAIGKAAEHASWDSCAKMEGECPSSRRLGGGCLSCQLGFTAASWCQACPPGEVPKHSHAHLINTQARLNVSLAISPHFSRLHLWGSLRKSTDMLGILLRRSWGRTNLSFLVIGIYIAYMLSHGQWCFHV